MRLTGDVCGIAIIVVESGFYYKSSNLEQGCLHLI